MSDDGSYYLFYFCFLYSGPGDLCSCMPHVSRTADPSHLHSDATFSRSSFPRLQAAPALPPPTVAASQAVITHTGVGFSDEVGLCHQTDLCGSGNMSTSAPSAFPSLGWHTQGTANPRKRCHWAHYLSYQRTRGQRISPVLVQWWGWRPRKVRGLPKCDQQTAVGTAALGARVLCLALTRCTEPGVVLLML